jgi:hypothetical protein
MMWVVRGYSRQRFSSEHGGSQELWAVLGAGLAHRLTKVVRTVDVVLTRPRASS